MSKFLRSAGLAHDIAAAVFRVAALVQHKQLRMELEEAAIGLVKGSNAEAVDKLGRLVRFTETVGEMSEINAEVLERELGNLRRILNTEISESIDKTLNTIQLDQFFAEKAQKTGEEEVEIGNQEERQAAILGYIRKFPNGCRMRQLSAIFSGFSERTIRADIQRLIDRGLVERIGSRTGPFSYFRALPAHLEAVSSADFKLESIVTKREPPSF